MKILPKNHLAFQQDTPNLYYINRLDFQRWSSEHKFEKLRQNMDSHFFAELPNSELNFLIDLESENIYSRMAECPALNRLFWIKQLGTVTSEPLSGMLYNGTRGVHSLQVAVMIEYVLRSLNYSEHDVNLGITSALLHDIASPPWSDQGKLGSPEDMCEEKNLGGIIERNAVLRRVLRDYDLKKEDVLACVRGKGFIGKLLNSRGSLDLDRIAYTAMDTYSVRRETMDDEFIDGLIRAGRGVDVLNRQSFDIYRYIGGYGKGPDLFFERPELVWDVLLMRALMFKCVYHSPSNQAREAFLGPILQSLWAQGKITRERLLGMDDGEFSEFLRKYMNEEMHGFFFKSKSYGISAEEVERADAGIDIKKLKHEYPKKKGYAIKPSKGFDPATQTPVFYEGKIRPFNEVFPEEASFIENISRELVYIGVYKLTKKS